MDLSQYMHITLMFFVSWALLTIFERHNYVKVFFMVIVLGVCKELWDVYEGNYFDIKDMGCNVLGFGLGCIIKNVKL